MSGEESQLLSQPSGWGEGEAARMALSTGWQTRLLKTVSMTLKCSFSFWVTGEWTFYEFDHFGSRKAKFQTHIYNSLEGMAVICFYNSLDERIQFPRLFESGLNP